MVYMQVANENIIDKCCRYLHSKNVLYTTIAKIKDERIKLRTKRELTEDDVMGVLLTAVKRHRESVEMYKKGDRPDLVEKEEKEIALLEKYLPKQLSEDEGLDAEGLEKVIGNYLFTEKPPMRDEVLGIMATRPKLRERGSIAERVITKIKDFVETFIDGID